MTAQAKTPVNFKGMLRLTEAAKHLGVSIATLRRWSDAGLVPSYRTLGGQRRYVISDLDDVLTNAAETHK